jgi:outer membrane receptor protein involved in Fe transport
LLALFASAAALSTAVAQTAPAANDEKKDDTVKLEKFVVTGSSIKRPADEGALPIAVFTQLDLQQEGSASAEQQS